MENNKGKTIRMKLGFLKNTAIDNSLGILILKKKRERKHKLPILRIKNGILTQTL